MIITRCIWVQLLPPENMTDEDYKALKVRLTQLVPSDRKHGEIEQQMLQTARRRNEWGWIVNHRLLRSWKPSLDCGIPKTWYVQAGFYF